MEPEVSQVVARAAAALAEAGCHVEEVTIPGLATRNTNEISLAAYGPEASLYLEPIIAGREDELSSNIRRRLALPTPTLREFIQARDEWEGLRQDIATYFSQYDLLLCPTSPVPARTLR